MEPLRPTEARYRIIDLLATGGMAEVYRAEAYGLGGFTKRVAIKRVKPELVSDRKFVHMFLDEARLGARLSHSNCVQVFDVSQASDPATGEDRYFLVMEYVDGASLRKLANWTSDALGFFPVAPAVYIIEQVCCGLAYAHSLEDDDGNPLRIVHRDVSPANVLITRHGEVKLADFGLAKAATHMTRSDNDIIKGKFAYLSPEAIRQQELDGRADLFATAAILWELLAGRKLFQGETPAQTIAAVERAVVPSLPEINPAVDPELDAIVKRALARERDERYPNAQALVRALNGWMAQHQHDVCAFDVAELVAIYRERRSQTSGLLAIGAAITEVQAQLQNVESVIDETPNWSEELGSFVRRAQHELESGRSLPPPAARVLSTLPPTTAVTTSDTLRLRWALGLVVAALLASLGVIGFLLGTS